VLEWSEERQFSWEKIYKNMSSNLDEIVEKSKREMKELSDKFKRDFDEFDGRLDNSRKLSISAISRLVFLSSGIVGFSVSLFSVQTIQSRLDLEALRFSWYFFVFVIIGGFFILIFEGRFRFAKAWKNFQVSSYPNAGNYDYSFREKFFATLILIISVFYPANLLFNRVYNSEEERVFKTRVNGLVVHKLASIENSLIFFENIIFISFICGILTLIGSFK